MVSRGLYVSVEIGVCVCVCVCARVCVVGQQGIENVLSTLVSAVEKLALGKEQVETKVWRLKEK